MYELKYAAIFVGCLLLATLLVGCGNGSDSDQASQQETQTQAQQYSLGEPIPFGGATWTFTAVEKLDAIPGLFGDEGHTPENGEYRAVYLDFQGDAENETMGVDIGGIFVLKDSQNNAYKIDTDLLNYEANDLAVNQGLTIVSLLMWQDPEPKQSVLVFDISPSSSGFLLEMRRYTDGINQIEAVVDLGI